jgi:diguanylate cyclase (GGDEF)-like protein
MRRYRADGRAGKSGWLLFADVDGLKVVNDSQGHAEGDRLIVCVAEAFRATLRESDTVGRLGGDEFAVYGSEAGERPEALRDRLMDAVARIGQQNGVVVSLSAGIAWCDSNLKVPFDWWLRSADNAMYEEKQAKRDKQAGIPTKGKTPASPPWKASGGNEGEQDGRGGRGRSQA